MSIGSRSLGGTRNDYFDDLDYIYGRGGAEDNFEDDFVVAHRRHKERAAAAFEEDLAELRRKRRDMQDRIFDVIDLNAEIERARNTLEAAGMAFQRHATKFDNEDDPADLSLTHKLDRTRKMASMDFVVQDGSKQKSFAPFKWTKVPGMVMPAEPDLPLPQPKPRQGRINSLVEATEHVENPLEILALQPMKRRFLKRKKSVSF